MDPFKLKKGLGRGLSSLIGDTKVDVNINKLSITDLVRNKFQPRKNFDKENLEELTNSIRERGVIQPIIVRNSEDIKNKFEIIAGERRWLAAQNAGLHDVPVVITEANDLKSLEFAIVENVQRHDLNPIEEAYGYQRLISDFGYDHEKVAKFIGKSRSHISNCLRLLSLPKEVIEMIKFCQDGHIPPEESRFVFRTAILSGQAVESDQYVREMFGNTDIFVVEIASKLEYRYKNCYVHHVAIDPDFNVPLTVRGEITVQKQSYESLEGDILAIRALLAPKRFFLVTHYSSYDRGERYQLVQWLEEV